MVVGVRTGALFMKMLLLITTAAMTVLVPRVAHCCDPYLGDPFDLQPLMASKVSPVLLTLRNVAVHISRGTGPGPGDCSDLTSVTFTPTLQVDPGDDYGIRVAFLRGAVPRTIAFPNYILARNARGPKLYWFDDLEAFDFDVAVSAVHRSGVEGKPYVVHLSGEPIYLARLEGAWFRVRWFWHRWGALVLPGVALSGIAAIAIYWRRRRKDACAPSTTKHQ
jgi:hypothetical protein